MNNYVLSAYYMSDTGCTMSRVWLFLHPWPLIRNKSLLSRLYDLCLHVINIHGGPSRSIISSSPSNMSGREILLSQGDKWENYDSGKLRCSVMMLENSRMVLVPACLSDPKIKICNTNSFNTKTMSPKRYLHHQQFAPSQHVPGSQWVLSPAKACALMKSVQDQTEEGTATSYSLWKQVRIGVKQEILCVLNNDHESE